MNPVKFEQVNQKESHSQGLNSRRVAFNNALIMAGLLLPVWWLLGQWRASRLLDMERRHVASDIMPYGAALTSTLERRFGLLGTLQSFVRTELDVHGEGIAKELAAFVPGLFMGVGGVHRISVFPQDAEVYIYPPGEAEDVAHDPSRLGSTAELQAELQRAIQAEGVIISGPVEHASGVQILVAREAVFNADGSTWGMLDLALELQPLFEEAGMMSGAADLRLALRDSSGLLLLGDQATLSASPVTVQIPLPEGHWDLAAIPNSGWEGAISDRLRTFQTATFAVVVVAVVLAYVISNRQATLSFAVRQRTQEISRINHRLQQELVEREQAEAAVRRHAADLEMLTKLSAALRPAETAAEVLSVTLEYATKVVNSSFSVVFLVDKESGEVVSQASYPSDLYPLHVVLQPGQGITGLVLGSGEPYVTADLKHDAAIDLSHVPAEEMPGPMRMVSLPLRTQQRLLGVLHVGARNREPFSPEDVQLLTAVSDIAANALQRAMVLKTLEERVAVRTEELEEANRKLKTLDQLKSKFIADISHELRTPLTNLNLYLDLLERGKPESRDRYLKILREKTEQLVSMTEGILELSQIDRHAKDREFELVDLNEVAQYVVVSFHQLFESAGLELAFDPCAGLPPVRGRRDELVTLMGKLLNNALTYTQSGTITIRTLLYGSDSVRLEVQDTGIGISEEDLPHVFDRFYRGQLVGQSNIPGTGLGLAVVKAIVVLHGGDIKVTSKEGAGSVFVVTFPIAGKD